MPQINFIQSESETKVVELNDDEILFYGLEDNDIALPHGCLAGSCGACRIDILEGAENLSPAGAIESDTIKQISNEHPGATIRLSCRAKIKGDVSFKVAKANS